MKPSWHYYEAHITIEEPTNPTLLVNALSFMGIKVVDLVNVKLEGLLTEEGIITTMHSDNLKDLTEKTVLSVMTLKDLGYKVLRYKIESTVIDSKHDDKLGLLLR